MQGEELLDIAEVCELLDITSRTLRFYEEKGLIHSTRIENSNRRKYDSRQIEQIRNILVLRTIGISIKNIQKYMDGNIQLETVVRLKRAEISASLNAKLKEIRLLNDTLAAIEDGEDIFTQKENQRDEVMTITKAIVHKCSEYIINGQLIELYPYFSQKMKDYMPIGVFEKVWKDSVNALGVFVRYGRIEQDIENENIIYQYITYEKMTIRIKYVFHGATIHGLWVQYCEDEKGLN